MGAQSAVIVSGSSDKTIRIWNAEPSVAVDKPLKGHTKWVRSVAFSPDGQHIVSGSYDKTIRIWNTATRVVVGNPLEGHTRPVESVAYSPDGRHIASGSWDHTIRIWDAETGAAVGKPLKGHTSAVESVGYSPDGRHIVSGSWDNIIRIWNAETSSCKPLHARFYSRPDSQGWVRDSDGGLLYWVPPDCRTGLHSPAIITIPLTSDIRSVSLDFNEFAFGTAWTQNFNSA